MNMLKHFKENTFFILDLSAHGGTASDRLRQLRR